MDPDIILNKADEMIAQGKHDEAWRFLAGLSPARTFKKKQDLACYHFYLASCLDREGKAKEADREFAEAARLDPKNQPLPSRLPKKEFEKIVSVSLGRLPARFRERLNQCVVRVEDYPGPDIVGDGLDTYILGVYFGTPRPFKRFDHQDSADFITLFKRNLEIEFPDPADLKKEIRKTVLHEVAHHFGLEDDQIED